MTPLNRALGRGHKKGPAGAGLDGYSVNRLARLGADESGEAFERTFERIVPPKRKKFTGHI